MAEWIGQIVFDPAVDTKLRAIHDLTPSQVRTAVSLGAHEDQWWHDHPVYGERLVLTGTDDKGPMIVYLRPIDRTDGLWECLTAWRLPDG